MGRKTVVYLVVAFILVGSGADGFRSVRATIGVSGPDGLVVDGQGIIPRGQLTEVISFVVSESDDPQTAELKTLEYEFWKDVSEAEGYHVDNNFSVSTHIRAVHVYYDQESGGGVAPEFSPDLATLLASDLTPSASGSISLGDFAMNDVTYTFFVVIEPEDYTTQDQGVVDSSLTTVHERMRGVFYVGVGSLHFKESGADEDDEEEIDTFCEELICESEARNVYPYYYFVEDVTAPDDDETVIQPDSCHLPGYSERPRWDLPSNPTVDSGSPPRPEMHQVLPLETATGVIGIACAGGTDSVYREERLYLLKIKFKDLTGDPDTGFDPRTMLDPIPIWTDYTNNPGEWAKWRYGGVMLYKDDDDDGEWDLGDDPTAPAAIYWYGDVDSDGDEELLSSTQTPADGIYTLHYYTQTGDSTCFINQTATEKYSYFIAIRADSGKDDENPDTGGDGTGVKFGADFRVYLDENGVYFVEAYGDYLNDDLQSGGPTSTDFSTENHKEIPLYPGAYFRTYLDADFISGLSYVPIDATSPVIPVFGLNAADTADTVTIAATSGGMRLSKVKVHFVNESGFDPRDDLAALEPPGASDEDEKNELRGVSLWKDSKSAGRIGVFDEEYDTVVRIADPGDWGLDENGWYVELEPIKAQEIYPEDSYSGGYRGDDYFVCIRTSDGIAYKDQFYAEIIPGDVDFGPDFLIGAGGSPGLTVKSDSIRANVPTFLSNLTRINQVIAADCNPTAVLGIKLYDSNASQTPTFKSLIVEFYDHGNPHKSLEGFDPLADLEPMSTDANSGLALYQDTNGNGKFDPGVDQAVTLSSVPTLLGLPGEPQYQFQLELDDPPTIPDNDPGDPNYFVVIQTSADIDKYDQFSVAIVGWGSQPQGYHALTYDDSGTETHSYERLETYTISAVSLPLEGPYSGGLADSTRRSGGGGGGGCFIATAVYDTRPAQEIIILRKFRDRYLLTNRWGRMAVNAYYRYGPKLAEKISRHEALKRAIRGCLKPLVRLAGLLTN